MLADNRRIDHSSATVRSALLVLTINTEYRRDRAQHNYYNLMSRQSAVAISSADDDRSRLYTVCASARAVI